MNRGEVAVRLGLRIQLQVGRNIIRQVLILSFVHKLNSRAHRRLTSPPQSQCIIFQGKIYLVGQPFRPIAWGMPVLQIGSLGRPEQNLARGELEKGNQRYRHSTGSIQMIHDPLPRTELDPSHPFVAHPCPTQLFDNMQTTHVIPFFSNTGAAFI